MTFSIVARCTESGMLGMAVASSSPAVAARCAFARAGVGAVATQNITDPRLGPAALELMAHGASASEAVAILVRSQAHMPYRQLLAVDVDGGTGMHTGEKTLGTVGQAAGSCCASAGNLLANASVPQAMCDAFDRSTGYLGERLVRVLEAARDVGGEAGPVHSAGLLLVDAVPWPVTDLRVDWDDNDPIDVLARLYRRYRPQLADYVTRALDPESAPAFGVPGDP